MTNQTIVVKTTAQKFQLKETVAVLAFSLLIPFLIHFIPTGEVPAGKVLLPIFIAPFIALVFFRWHVAAVAALLSPTLNYLITGNPVFPMLSMLTVELCLFIAIAYFLMKNKTAGFFAAPTASLVSIVVSHLLFNRMDHILTTIITSVPGLALMAVINVLILALAKKLK